MPKILVKRFFDDLKPADDEARCIIRQMPDGEAVEINVPKKQRSQKHHRLFYGGICAFVCSHDDRFKTVDQVAAYFKLRTGHVDVIQVGEHIVQVPKSVSFSSMDQYEFSDFFSRCLYILDTEIIPGIGCAAARREIYAMTGINLDAA